MGRYRKGEEYFGYNEDCFNCPYPDCRKPVAEMSPLRDVGLSKAFVTAESQGKMYTIVIKDYGKNAIEDGQSTLDPVDDILLIQGAVKMIPAAEVEEVRHGKWIPFGDAERQASGLKKCSLCGVSNLVEYKYCPECGAKMDGK